MNEPTKSERRSRFLGCLLGGAAGDALGYPVEFWTEGSIARRFGPQGICTLSEAGDPAVISDDTQMTLFASCALVAAACRPELTPEQALRAAYVEWLTTQLGPVLIGKPRPLMWIWEDRRLHEERAPGNTCIRSLVRLGQEPEIGAAENNSKGCGTVMRAAPFGLTRLLGPEADPEENLREARKLARYDAAITHGHPAAADASALQAAIVFRCVNGGGEGTLADLVRGELGEGSVDRLVRRAVELAEDPSVKDLDGIHALGEGWVADEALAIAVFCAVRHADDFASALRAAVNHQGDSDSTGAICGNILGARLGVTAVTAAFPPRELELSDITVQLAEDLFLASEGRLPGPGKDPVWDQQYYKR